MQTINNACDSIHYNPHHIPLWLIVGDNIINTHHIICINKTETCLVIHCTNKEYNIKSNDINETWNAVMEIFSNKEQNEKI